jgi:MATE family multidrug resistance protein
VRPSSAAIARLNLPAQRVDGQGRSRIDWAVIASLAVPFVANSAVQAILNLTDTWFIGRISTQDVAAIGAVYWLVLVVILLLGGIGLAVQTVVAQAFGAGRYRRAAQSTWTALWGTLLTVPIFVACAWFGGPMLALTGIDPAVAALAVDYWMPRVAFAWIGVALWSVLGFFNGIGHPRITLLITLGTALLNALLNQLLIFELGLGIAGAAWATSAAMLAGLAVAVVIFVSHWIDHRYRSRLTWRPRARRLVSQFSLGFPMGLLFAADLLGFALFQLMQVRLGAVDGAATQIAMMLTSLAYFPAAGLAMAGTTLVGQSIGAGDRGWARQLGNAVILACTGYMALTGLALAVSGRWLVALFVAHDDPLAAEVIAVGALVLWIAAAYQLFDGLNLGSSFCLRGAGDAFVPAVMVIVLSWLLFVPAAHVLTFAPGEGWIDGLPQLGWGATGGWTAAVLYIAALGITMFLRWRSRAWERLRLR